MAGEGIQVVYSQGIRLHGCTVLISRSPCRVLASNPYALVCFFFLCLSNCVHAWDSQVHFNPTRAGEKSQLGKHRLRFGHEGLHGLH